MPMTSADHYLLERSDAEYEWLREHMRMWEPETARLLDRVGLTARASCLDVGCGPGEVMRLLAERVGPEGHVLGVDVDERLGARALERLHAAGHHQCRFQALDVESGLDLPDGPFDVVVSRLVLIHVADPVAVLRRLWDAVAPGGHLVLQEYDLLSGDVVPRVQVAEDFKRVACGTFERAGRDPRIGLRLAALHAAGELGPPDGIDAGVRVGRLSEMAPKYEAVYRSVRASALRLGAITDDEAAAWFEAFARIGPHAHEHVALWPLLIGTWKQKNGG